MANTEQKTEGLRVDEALSASELFVEKYKKPIIICVSAIVLIVLAVIGYRSLYLAPRAVEAANHMASAQTYLETDSFRLALEGDNLDCIGFAAVADEYSNTPSGRVAKLYSGICAYKLGRYEEAADYLKSYKGKDLNTAPMAKELLGNAHAELNQTDDAIKAFESVVKLNHDIYSPRCLMKMAAIYQSQGDNAKALEAYQRIKDDYATSLEARDIDKYIANLQ